MGGISEVWTFGVVQILESDEIRDTSKPEEPIYIGPESHPWEDVTEAINWHILLVRVKQMPGPYSLGGLGRFNCWRPEAETGENGSEGLRFCFV